jgi:hypothetical protein
LQIIVLRIRTFSANFSPGSVVDVVLETMPPIRRYS